MSEFCVQVVQLGKIGKHPNADTLSITQVLGCPVILRTGQFQSGDKAVYVSVDAVVPLEDERWSFLKSNRIKAMKLRGIFSMGILTECTDPTWEVGMDVREQLKITKHEEPWVRAFEHGLVASPPRLNWPMYDLEGYRKFGGLLTEGEPVVITEKIHGCNGRWTFQDGQLHVGSHRVWKKDVDQWDKPVTTPWHSVAVKHDLLDKLALMQDHTFYGEVYGGKLQDLKYGCKADEVRLAIFDIRAPNSQWLEWEQVQQICTSFALPTVPLLYHGFWNPVLLSLADGKTTMPGASHIREGIVIQPVPERFDHIGRVKLKMVSEASLLRSEKAEKEPAKVAA
jgi:RNA ligase (TIGR02306 family)